MICIFFKISVKIELKIELKVELKVELNIVLYKLFIMESNRKKHFSSVLGFYNKLKYNEIASEILSPIILDNILIITKFPKLFIKIIPFICRRHNHDIMYSVLKKLPSEHLYIAIKEMFKISDRTYIYQSLPFNIPLDVKLLKLITKYVPENDNCIINMLNVIINIYAYRKNNANNKLVKCLIDFTTMSTTNGLETHMGNCRIDRDFLRRVVVSIKLFVERGYIELTNYKHISYCFKKNIFETVCDDLTKIALYTDTKGSNTATIQKLLYIIVNKVLKIFTTKNMSKLIRYFYQFT